MINKETKRNAPRVPLKVKMYVNGERGEGLLFFYTANISKGGAFLISGDLFLKTGEKMDLDFALPLRDEYVPMHLNCVVCRRQEHSTYSEDGFMPPGMGIQFENVDPIALQKIDQYITLQLSIG
jgi:c-di-GMP-binding flagellar brake protein YcgR